MKNLYNSIKTIKSTGAKVLAGTLVTLMGYGCAGYTPIDSSITAGNNSLVAPKIESYEDAKRDVTELRKLMKQKVKPNISPNRYVATFKSEDGGEPSGVTLEDPLLYMCSDNMICPPPTCELSLLLQGNMIENWNFFVDNGCDGIADRPLSSRSDEGFQREYHNAIKKFLERLRRAPSH